MRDQRGHVDPERAIAIQPIDDQPEQRQRHEEDRRGRAAALEDFVGHPAAQDRAGNAGELEQRPGQARLLERKSLRRLQIGRNPVHHAVAHEIDERVRHRDRPEKLVVEHVAEEDLLEGQRALVRRRVLRRIIVLVLLDRRKPAALRRVAQQESTTTATSAATAALK